MCFLFFHSDENEQWAIRTKPMMVVIDSTSVQGWEKMITRIWIVMNHRWLCEYVWAKVKAAGSCVFRSWTSADPCAIILTQPGPVPPPFQHPMWVDLKWSQHPWADNRNTPHNSVLMSHYFHYRIISLCDFSSNITSLFSRWADNVLLREQIVITDIRQIDLVTSGRFDE